MNPFDEDDEGEISIGERSAAERDLTPDIPEAPSVKTFEDDGDFSSAADVRRETLRAFVACVIYANAALLLVALGPMVWAFEGWTRIGAVLFAGGILAGIRTYQTYREWDQDRESSAAGGESGDASDAGESTPGNDDAPTGDDDGTADERSSAGTPEA